MRAQLRYAVAWAEFTAQAAPIITQAVREEAPGSGKHVGRIYVRRGLNSLQLVAGKPWPWVIGGTRPHVIEARNASALSFEWRGEQVFFRRVHHPGTHPNPFHLRGYMKVRRRIRTLLVEAAGKGLVIQPEQLPIGLL